MWTDSWTSSNSTAPSTTGSSDIPGVYNPSYEHKPPVAFTWEHVEMKAKEIFEKHKLSQFEKRRMREDEEYREKVLKLQGVESEEGRIGRLKAERENALKRSPQEQLIEKKEFEEFMERAKISWNCHKLGFTEDSPQGARHRDLELDRLAPEEIQEEQIPDAILIVDRRRSI